MKKMFFRKAATLVIVLILLLSFTISAFASSVRVDEIPTDTYTYWDNSVLAYSTKSVYNFKKEIDGKSLGFEFMSLSDIANDKEGNSYVLDGAASTVFVLDSNYKFKYSFGAFEFKGEEIDFTDATGIEYRDGKIFICDTYNARVLQLSADGTPENVIYLPESDLIPEDFIFKPIKVAVDSSGYIYVLSDGSYYGAILYSPEGEFLGFYGSNTVETGLGTALQTIWENLTMTDEKRANSARKLPYQFTDLFVDNMDFVYTATGRTGENLTEKGQIKRMNPGGINILTEGNDVTFGDLKKSTVRFRGSTWRIDSNVCNVIVDEDAFIYALDRESSRIFIYDGDCNYISVFGGGNGDVSQKGAPKKISAIGMNGYDVIVLDERKNNIAIFERTEYGKMFMSAQAMVLNGDYAEAKELWERVHALDKNNQLAYKGLAKAYVAVGDYEKALEYAKDGLDVETYDQAYTLMRNESLSENFNTYAIVAIVVVCVLIVALRYKKKKNIVLVKSEKVKVLTKILTSPVESFTAIKQKKLGSFKIATILMLICYISEVAKSEWSGFQFVGTSGESFNSLLTLVKTIGAVLLFTIANWGVATLMQGRGTLKEIYVVTCYSLIPLIISNFAFSIITHFISLSEEPFLSILTTALLLYTVVLFIFGLMAIHDVSFGKFLGITILSIAGILVVIFVGVVVFLLAQQLYSFVMTIVNELQYR